MGYVEDIQKINKLAKELQQHGMASDLDDAVKKAKDMLKNELTMEAIPNPTEFKKKSKEEPKEEKEEIKVEELRADEVDKPREEARDRRTGMTWQDAMAKNNQYIVPLLQKMETQLNSYRDEIISLRREVDKLKEGQRTINVLQQNSNDAGQHSQQQQQHQQEPLQQEKPKAEQKTQGQPRHGTYNPEDVAIDKMFYFGNKSKN